MLKRLTFLAYGLAAYVIFLGTFLYAIAFVGGFGVPTQLDGNPETPLGMALAIDAALLTIFAVQHSVMARRWFKDWWTQIVPWAIERSTFVLFASLALLLLFWQWRPIGIEIWSVTNPFIRVVLWLLFASGWGTVLVVTFLINHFDLFGLRQVWLPMIGRPYTRIEFRTPMPYRHVRHPLYFGFLLAFWMTPTMTLAHLVFAIATTAYIILAIQFEERDLVAEYGQAYEDYRRGVPMLIPSVSQGSTTRSVATRTIAVLALAMTLTHTVHAAGRVDRPVPPQVPAAIQVPTGYIPYLSGHAIGTQGYVCVASGSLFSWAPFGPQATLFNEDGQETLTHFLSPTPYSLLPNPTWQHSRDTSAVWGQPIASSSDPVFVAADAIPWLLLEAVVVGDGPTGGDKLVVTRYIQRVNTIGGQAPSTGCASAADIKKRALVPYQADYFFYREKSRGRRDDE